MQLDMTAGTRMLRVPRWRDSSIELQINTQGEKTISEYSTASPFLTEHIHDDHGPGSLRC